MLEVTPLGTGSALPSKEKHFSATTVAVENELFLFDCGEGTQHRLLEASARWSRLKAIFITHLHGDHYFGLPGLLSTLSLLQHEKPLHLIGPVGIGEFVTSLPSRQADQQPSYILHITELDHTSGVQEVYASAVCNVITHPLVHGVPAYGYRIEEPFRPGKLDAEKARNMGVEDVRDFKRLKKGEPVPVRSGMVQPQDVVGPGRRGASFAYVTDTRPCEGGKALAREASLCYHEATFAQDDLARAHATNHSTAMEAATIAQEAGVEQLLIGHFSARYKDTDILVAEAQSIFKNTAAAEELKRYTLQGRSIRNTSPEVDTE
ncbi:MAG: ribonuclease Z [Bacteroidota bacterium]